MINDILKKFPDETEEECLFRIGSAKHDGLLDVTWPVIADFMNETFRSDETEYRTESAYRKRYKCFIDAKEMLDKQDAVSDGTADELTAKLREIEKAKIKLRTEKLEYNAWLRQDAREELIVEHIKDAIAELPSLSIPKLIVPRHSERAAVLVIADAHYGKELNIKGLFGETLNEYSPEIFEERMWDLLNQTIEICDKEGLDILNIYDLGDEIEGLLRISTLMKLKYGVIESAVRYSRFITEWLNELTKHIRVRYQMVFDSNHCQLRLLNGKKNTFQNENVSIIIQDKIIDRLSNNPNFEFIHNPTGYVFDTILGYNVFGFHGECKQLSQAIKDFSGTYKIQLDFVIGAHKHHGANEQVGIESEVISVPSIIGVDDYSLFLNKTSDPGASLIVFEQGRGKTIEYNIKLK